MGRFLKILGGILGVVVVVLVGGIVYVLNVDLNDWKPEIEQAAMDATGRKLVLGGPIEFNLGSDTYLKATDISFSNADWGTRPEMAEVDSVEVGLKLFSLMGSTPDISMIHVDGVRVIVETNDKGVSNTEMAGAKEAEHHDDDHGGSGDLVLPIIRDLRIAGVEVVMKDAVAGTEQTFVLTELTLGSQSESDPLMLNLDAAFDDLALIMAGQIGSLRSMTSSSEATPIDLVGNLAGIDVAINGQIQDLAGQEGIDVTITALGAELADAAKIAGIDIPSLGEFKVDATLKGSGDALSVNPLRVNIGTSDVIRVAVDGQIDDAIGQEGINLAIAVESTQIGNLSPITQALAKQDVPALGPLNVAFNVNGGLSRGLKLDGLDAKVGSADLLLVTATGDIADVATQKGINLNIAIASPQVGAMSAISEKLSGQKIPALGPLDLTLNVSGNAGDVLSVKDLALALGSSDLLALSVSGGVADVMQQKGIALDVAAASSEIGSLSGIAQEFAGQKVPALGPLDLKLKVSGDAQATLAITDLAMALGKPEMLELSVVGGISDLLQQNGISLSVTAKSPELGNLSEIAKEYSGQEIPDIGPLAMSAKINGGMASTLGLTELALDMGRAETVQVQANGGVSDLLKLSGADLGFKVVSPDLSALSGLVGSEVPPIGPVNVSGTVKGDSGQPIRLDPFVATIGGSDISGTATFDGTGDVPSIVAKMSSTRFDINDVNPPPKGGTGGSTAPSGGASSGGAADDGKVIPGDVLPLDGLKAINAEIDYSAGTFVAAVSELTNMSIKISLQDGKLNISPFTAGVGAGSLDGAITLDGTQAMAPLTVRLDGKQMGLESFLAGAGMRDKIEGPLDLTINLTGAGNSPRSIAASLDGKIATSMYDSRVLEKAFEEALGGTITSMLDTENGWVVIDCAVFDYDLKDGLMDTKAGYTASGSVTVATSGTINLANEELSLNVKPAGGGGFGSVPLQVSGTFANPSVIPDPVSIGTGILAGVLTGGLAPALLAVVADLPDGHPCKQEVTESQQQLENSEASQPAAEPSSPADAASDAVKGVGEAIGKGIGNLFGN